MPSLLLSPSLWETVKCDFKGLFPEDVFQMWFEPIVCLEATEDSMTLGVPNDFAAIWIHDNYLDLITQRLRLTAGRLVNIKLKRVEATHGGKNLPAAHAHTPSSEPARAKTAASRRTPRYDDRSGAFAGTLNPRNTFENFVVGSNNQMAHAAALAVAQAPAQAYNPLFIYGDTGLGKTHLMHAVGHAILRHNPDSRVAYLSTEKFTNEFIQALQENSLTKFRQRYRHVDVLLLDDVQFLAGKERIQEEFFHTFNDLFESGKQIVLSSDRRASEIQKLESRLVSRFEWGLPADIQPPDYETRLAILRTKAANIKFDLPGPVANFIAQHISKNIRRLEGALIKVASYSTLTSKALDLATVEMLLQDVLMEQAQNQLTIET
ncbi:MAG: chromosomal replication initiator protein DnaA, partial [Verrucomicrobiota bacterium]|nr:chromosomal replication initiator protein DnaA [Verrucomicrobiota bacterium]